MKKIVDIIEVLKSTPSDINEHLQTLVNYSKECEHVTDFGVRSALSTWSLLLHSKKIRAYDIRYDDRTEYLQRIVKEYNIDFKYIIEDVLKADIENTDLLFIDTLHCYKQLIQELNLHAVKVNKYIIIHDTMSFGSTDEVIYEHASEIVKSIDTEKKGLKNAIKDFLETDEGSNWCVHQEFFNNNGLTILKRKWKMIEIGQYTYGSPAIIGEGNLTIGKFCSISNNVNNDIMGT